VATDSIKNTIYIKAKEHPVNPPELYASHLGQHFLDRYPHISAAHIRVVVHRWTRMTVDGAPHPHSFFRDGQETRNVEATVARGTGITLESSIAGLPVLKSTGSAFHGFVRDEFTTLAETWDRILSTDVDCAWTWRRFPTVAAVQDGVERFDKAWESARGIVMKTFATDESASVQNTMYKMCEQILEAVPEVDKVAFSLPNKHYFEIGVFFFFSIFTPSQARMRWNGMSTNTTAYLLDLSWHKGTKNTGKDAEVYAPQSGPNGLIKCEVARDVSTVALR
jgi:urate oxidase